MDIKVNSVPIVIIPWCLAGGHQVSVQGRPPPSVHSGELWERGGLPLGRETGLGHSAEAREHPTDLWLAYVQATFITIVTP